MRTIFSIFIWTYWAVCIISFFVLILMVYLITFPFDRHRVLSNKMLKLLAWLMLKVNPGWKIILKGGNTQKIKKPVIVVANHQSFLDLPLLYLLPWTMKWVAKRDLFKIPILGWIIFMTGHLGIDRKRRSSVKKLDKLVVPIKEGIPGLIFPEGTRSADGQLLRFKMGAFRMAKQYNFNILPVVLNGGHQAMPQGEWRIGYDQDFEISVLDPVSPDDFESANELNTYVYSLIEKELRNIQTQ
jgi:1-acyl-sn-glycerol-3-phosphate acyltransferase